MASFADCAATLERIAAAASTGCRDAANEMAGVFRSTVRREMYMGHFLHTKTPRPPGEPPAWISGDLKNSVVNEPAHETSADTWQARSGPTVRYARIQELGGPMEAHSERGMRWQEPPGVWHRSMAHDLPPRPYMKPANEALATGPELSEAAAAPIQAAIRAAI